MNWGAPQMRGLSISAAWDESKAILAHDGRLLMTVALALVAFPSAINNLINPAGVAGTSPLWVDAVTFVVTLLTLTGQLALIRLALGPSITVGSAISHGFQRLPAYCLVVVILLVGLFLLAVPCAVVLAALGVPLETRPLQLTPAAALVLLIYLAVAVYFAVRLVLSSAVASAEDLGPIAILKRSWRLTAGNWWTLFGFLMIFVVAAIVLLVAIGSAAGVIVNLLVGSLQPMSAAALIVALIQAVVSAAITALFSVMLARIYLQLAGRNAQASVPSSGI
ncbi:MAG: hypothetical protein ACJ8EH_13435 [Sphingomicrobium sp.]